MKITVIPAWMANTLTSNRHPITDVLNVEVLKQLFSKSDIKKVLEINYDFRIDYSNVEDRCNAANLMAIHQLTRKAKLYPTNSMFETIERTPTGEFSSGQSSTLTTHDIMGHIASSQKMCYPGIEIHDITHFQLGVCEPHVLVVVTGPDASLQSSEDQRNAYKQLIDQLMEIEHSHCVNMHQFSTSWSARKYLELMD